MVEILEFIFQDGWHYLGFLVLLVTMTFFRFVEIDIDKSERSEEAEEKCCK